MKEAIADIIKAQQEYIEFLSASYNKVYSIAHIHHYRTSEEDINKGIELRERIQELQKILDTLPVSDEEIEQAAIESGYPQSDKERFEITYWTLHNVFCNGAKWMRENY